MTDKYLCDKSSLHQIMVWCLFRVKPLPEWMVTYCPLYPQKEKSTNFKQKYKFPIKKMLLAAILFRVKCVKNKPNQEYLLTAYTRAMPTHLKTATSRTTACCSSSSCKVKSTLQCEKSVLKVVTADKIMKITEWHNIIGFRLHKWKPDEI